MPAGSSMGGACLPQCPGTSLSGRRRADGRSRQPQTSGHIRQRYATSRTYRFAARRRSLSSRIFRFYVALGKKKLPSSARSIR
jgi:hypothetical protein